jgi:hypothetical protein
MPFVTGTKNPGKPFAAESINRTVAQADEPEFTVAVNVKVA